METLLSIAALLESSGAKLADICSATLFVKEPETLGIFKEVIRLLGVPDFPVCACRGDGVPSGTSGGN